MKWYVIAIVLIILSVFGCTNSSIISNNQNQIKLLERTKSYQEQFKSYSTKKLTKFHINDLSQKKNQELNQVLKDVSTIGDVDVFEDGKIIVSIESQLLFEIKVFESGDFKIIHDKMSFKWKPTGELKKDYDELLSLFSSFDLKNKNYSGYSRFLDDLLPETNSMNNYNLNRIAAFAVVFLSV